MRHIKNYKNFNINESINIVEVPKIMYHATPLNNIDSIMKFGLKPKLKSHAIESGEIHQDRIFLSIYNNPYNMNLPADKINSDLKILTISTDGLNRNLFFPDDSLYWAFYNDELDDYALSVIFPKYWKLFKDEDLESDDMTFGDWLIDNDYDVTPEELEKILKGKYYLTLPDNKIISDNYDAGEIAYKGIIPPSNILDINDAKI